MRWKGSDRFAAFRGAVSNRQHTGAQQLLECGDTTQVIELRREGQVARTDFEDEMNPKRLADPPMTLGNMRRLGVHNTALTCFSSLGWCE
jgi:hypothetical protein